MKTSISTKKAAFLAIIGVLMLLATVNGVLANPVSNIQYFYLSDTATTSGTTAYDVQGAYDATLTDSGQAGFSGVINEAYNFDVSSSQSMSTGYTGSLGAFTVCTWINMSSAQNGKYIVRDNVGAYWILGAGFDAGWSGSVTNKYWFGTYDTNYDGVASTTSQNTGTFQHVCGVHLSGGTSNVIYINGVAEASVGANVITGNGGAVYGGSAGRFIDASMDNIVLWSRALTADDIANVYANESAGCAYNGTGWDCGGGGGGAGGDTSYTLNVINLYDDSALSGVNVTFDTGCSNLTDASGIARVTNSTVGCAALSGALSGVTTSLSGYIANDTSYAINENSTGYGGMYVRIFNFTNVFEKITGDVIASPFNITTDGAKVYSDGLNIYALNDLDNYTFKKTNYYDFTAIMNSTNTTMYGVYDNIFTINAKNITGSAITSSTNITVSNSTLGFSETCITTNGTCYFGLIQGHNYNFSIQPEGYEYLGVILEANSTTNTYTSYHYLMNTVMFSFYDAETLLLIDNNTVYLEMISLSMSDNYTTSNGTLETDILSPDTYTLRYNALGYLDSFYVFTIEDNYHYYLDLYLYNETTTSNVTIIVRDTVGNTLEGATVKILKYDVVSNDYLITEILSTNFEGKTVGNIVLNNEYYKFFVEYGDDSITTNPTYIYGTEITLYLTIGSQGFEDYFSSANIDATLAHSYTTHTTTFTYNDRDNVATGGCIYAYRLTGSTKTLYNSSCGSGSANTLFVGLINTSGVVYKLEGVVTKGSDYNVATGLVDYHGSAPESGLGLLLLVFLEMTVVMVGFWSLPVAVLLGGVLPLLFGLIGLANLPLTITVPLLGISVIIAYLVGVKR